MNADANTGQSAALAAYAARLRFEDMPRDVVARAKDCLIDTVAISMRGGGPVWSRIVIDHVLEEGSKGRSQLIGVETAGLRAESATFANAVLAHALELDSLRKPGAGVHPGAIIVPAALAVAQEIGASGRDLLVAIIAGVEVLHRIGASTHHSIEPRGLHAPGLTGPFGSAAAAGHLFRLDAEALNNAFGIAASSGSGLMQFSAEGQGAMVKRFHIGRAAQSGVVAARLAAKGFAGPKQSLEGEKGFLRAYCGEFEPELLTDGFGQSFETLKLCLKRYPCHITAHTAVYSIESLKRETGLLVGDVASVRVIGTDRMAKSNGDQRPRDAALANYSIPFCVAAALTAPADDPASFDPARLNDEALRELCLRIEVASDGRTSHSDWATTTIVTCRNGTVHERRNGEFPGTPGMPISANDLKRRFEVMTRGRDPARMRELFGRLANVEGESLLDWIH